MERVPRKSRRWRRALIRRATKTRCPTTIRRAQLVATASSGRVVAEIAEVFSCARSHVYQTLARFEESGWPALLDGRRDNGGLKADASFRSTVRDLLDQSPRDYGYLRPTWTRELLILVAEEQTGVRVGLSAMSRVLHRIGARRGRPKPAVACPLSDRQRRRRLRKIRQLLANLPHNEVAVYEDEIDIHLNQKIGLDWMNASRQKLVMTPGQNKKAYLAGTLDARTGDVLWVGGALKDSALFVAMLEKLDRHHGDAKRIHVILDNYGIHKSKLTQAAIRRLPRIWLHFLPPYCPDENRIERLWLDLHANVTRNHKHSELTALCADVATYLDYVSPWKPASNLARPPARLDA
jgi:transposase